MCPGTHTDPEVAQLAPNDGAAARSEPDEPAWMARACVLVPAFDAERTLGAVIDELRRELGPKSAAIFVIDDGSTDATADVARARGCTLVSLATNRGKGAALKAGLRAAADEGFDVALTVDADGQHPASEAKRVLHASPDPETLVLGVRDLVGAGAPRKNQLSNGISNYFLSRFAGRRLSDTQCGLRRYPIRKTLELAAHGTGYEFEGEVLLRAVWRNVPIVEQHVEVLYPEDRVTHFRVSRDPWRILRTVVFATIGERARGLKRSSSRTRGR